MAKIFYRGAPGEFRKEQKCAFLEKTGAIGGRAIHRLALGQIVTMSLETLKIIHSLTEMIFASDGMACIPYRRLVD